MQDSNISDLYPSVNDLRARMSQAMQEGRYTDALPLLNTLISHDPNEAAIWFSRGLAHYFLRQSDEAIHDLTQAIEKGERSGDVYYVRGNCLARIGKFDEARKDYTRAIREEPTTAYLLERAKVHQTLGRYKDAIDDLDQGIALSPEDGSLYFVRARLSHRSADDTFKDLVLALEKGYKRPEVYFMQGQYFEAFKDNGRALEAYTTSISLDKRHVESLVGRARVYTILEQHDNALADLNQAVKTDPQHKYARLDRGIAYLRREQSSDHIAARRDFGELLKGDTPLVLAYYFRALAYIKLNKPDRAEHDLWTFVTHESTEGGLEVMANAWLIVALALQDKWDDVLDQVNMAREFFPNLATIDDIATRAEFTPEQKSLYVKAWGIPS